MNIKMKYEKSILCITLITFSHYLLAQGTESSLIEYPTIGIRLKISQDTSGNQVLSYHAKNKEDRSWNLISESDLFTFSAEFLGKRKFVVIRGRHYFFIFDLMKQNLTGPIEPNRRSIGEDAQSGILGDIQIFDNGKYLMVRVVDDGIHAYSVVDIDRPTELECHVSANSPYNHFFLDRRPGGLYNGINATTDNGWQIISTSYLFQGWRFKEVNGKIIKSLRMDRYLDLNHKVGRRFEPLIIDYLTGTLVNK